MSIPATTGIHHVTAIASDPQRTLDFYTGALGLRLVKLTVNFDDPGAYHFYFGNDAGSPGSILTFFPWPGARRGRVGVGQVSATSFAVLPDSLRYWEARLTGLGVPAEAAGLRFGEPVLRFGDPDGLPLELIETADAAPGSGWSASTVDRAHAIGGFHGATLDEEGYERTAGLLEALGFRKDGHEGSRYRFRGPEPGPGSVIDVLCQPNGAWGQLGAGTVHHIAWRATDDEEQLRARRALVDGGFNVSPVMDRTYFHSIYFREPGGILFEIATDPPGFTLDEEREHLGERLMLPDWIESQRPAVERALPALVRPGSAAGEGAARTSSPDGTAG